MENKKMSLWEQSKPYLAGLQFALLIAFLATIVSNIITVYGPTRIKEMTNIIASGLETSVDVAAVAAIGGFLAVIYVIGLLSNYLQAFLFTTAIQRFSERLRRAIAEKINRLPLRYFDGHSQGDTLSRVTNDVDTAAQSLNQSLGTVLSSSLLVLAVLVTMFGMNWILALVTVVSTFIGFTFVSVFMGKSQGFFKSQQQDLAAVNGYVEEMYSGHNVVTSYNAIESTKEEFAKLNNRLYDSIWKSQFISGIMMPIMMFIGNFSYALVIIVGAALALNGQISIGIIVAFMAYVRIFSQPLSQIAQGITSLQQASVAMGRVFEFLAEEEMEDESHKARQLSNMKGQVVFDRVSFGYTPERTIIHDFSATAHAGQKVAIVGPTGAGKTTIVNLLMKFYEIDKGSIRIDGVDSKEMKRSEVHDAFSMVLQDTWLFEGTIRDNLIYNQKGISDERVIEASKAVGIHHFIMTLPDGYDTVLDDTVTLSVGQKQLLTIARALLKDAPLLILDEATSSVDTRTEELIQKAMDRLMEGRTSFVIAHRLSTIRNADLILVMKDGNIIEQGNHEELMAQAGFYADLYNSQFTEDEAEE
ncbi:ABC transporter ATP-binding protein [Streptococcus mitis]|uniref:Putative ABC transporter ATP-binding protein n=1 Tax=Streptococcus mitis TaxID=28037 RepID=A0A3R9IQC9_STRMT|nr:ABC transporter ATP-binding protein [Streptococcus mitis]RSI86618.1 putative ABC transporter ATP-binding protein [Streptococcus mitis]RSI91524.1 putative ABC transporter ATP-binding protein [Streptococcus mitis]